MNQFLILSILIFTPALSWAGLGSCVNDGYCIQTKGNATHLRSQQKKCAQLDGYWVNKTCPIVYQKGKSVESVPILYSCEAKLDNGSHSVIAFYDKAYLPNIAKSICAENGYSKK